MKNIIIIFIGILMMGCCPCKHIIPTQDVVYMTKDSIVYTERIDTVFVKLTPEHMENVSRGNSHLETSYAISDANIGDDGFLYHTLINKSINIPVQVVEKEVVHTIVKDSLVTVKVPVEVTKVKTKFPNSYWIMLSLLILIIGFKLYSIFRMVI